MLHRELDPTINSAAFDQEFKVRVSIVPVSCEYLHVSEEKPASSNEVFYLRLSDQMLWIARLCVYFTRRLQAIWIHYGCCSQLLYVFIWLTSNPKCQYQVEAGVQIDIHSHTCCAKC